MVIKRQRLIEILADKMIDGNAIYFIGERYIKVETYDNDGVIDSKVTDADTGALIMKSNYGEWTVYDAEWVNDRQVEVSYG